MPPAGHSDLLQEFFELAPDLLFLLDRSGVILALSEPLRRLLGEEARAGIPLLMFLHPDAHGAFAASLGALAEGEPMARLTCAVRVPGGAFPAFELRARRTPGEIANAAKGAKPGEAGGEISGSLRALEDAQASAAPALTPAEAAKLAEEGRLLRALHGSLDMVVWAADAEEKFIYQAGRGLARAGLRPGAFVGQRVSDVYSAPEFQELIRSADEGRFAHTYSEAHHVAWENWMVLVRGAPESSAKVVGMSVDLTDVRKADRELRTKIELIERQQQVIQAMATPIIEVWDKVLTLPMVGLVDSVRAAEVMDNLLQQVARKAARFAILDLTGVEGVDTSTASHLLKLIQALRLLGAEGIITGIQPDVAQTMVALGMNLETIVTLANLRDGLRLCMRKLREGEDSAA